MLSNNSNDVVLNPNGLDLLGYFVLMVYQRYHTGADIGTTAAIIAPPLLLVCWLLREKPDQPGPDRPDKSRCIGGSEIRYTQAG